MIVQINGVDWCVATGEAVHVRQLTLRDKVGLMGIALEAFPQDYPHSQSYNELWLRRYLDGLPQFYPVGVCAQGNLVAYLIWENLGGPGGDIAEYLQTAVHHRWRGLGLGKLITVVGRELLDRYRQCCGMVPVRKVKVSTGHENPAQALYRKWLLDPSDTQCVIVPRMYFGNPEAFLTGTVLPTATLESRLVQDGFRRQLED